MKKKILKFCKRKIIQTAGVVFISVNDELDHILQSIKRHYANIKSIFSHIILIVRKILFGFVADTKLIMETRHKAGKNNYILGVQMLKENFLPDAKIRFLLSDMFYNKSAMTKYYIAYIYYLEGNYNKSLQYLKKSVTLRPTMKISSDLLAKIENDMKVVKNKS
jgi:hypothetical protein